MAVHITNVHDVRIGQDDTAEILVTETNGNVRVAFTQEVLKRVNPACLTVMEFDSSSKTFTKREYLAFSRSTARLFHGDICETKSGVIAIDISTQPCCTTFYEAVSGQSDRSCLCGGNAGAPRDPPHLRLSVPSPRAPVPARDHRVADFFARMAGVKVYTPACGCACHRHSDADARDRPRPRTRRQLRGLPPGDAADRNGLDRCLGRPRRAAFRGSPPRNRRASLSSARVRAHATARPARPRLIPRNAAPNGVMFMFRRKGVCIRVQFRTGVKPCGDVRFRMIPTTIPTPPYTKKLLSVYDALYRHNGFGEMTVEVRILKKQQKEILIKCGKQYRFVVDWMNNAPRLGTAIPLEATTEPEEPVKVVPA
jgi:hypothetical protein